MHAFLIFAPLFTLTGCSGQSADDSSPSADTDTDTDSDTDSDSDSDTDTDTDTDSDTDTDANMCTTDVCATYGSAVPLVAKQITETAAADPEFAPFFAPLVAEGDAAVADFETSLANFISDAYGCTSGAYTGPSMPDAHHGMAITQAQYDDFIGMIAGILTSDGVPDDDVNFCFAPPLQDPVFSATIVGQ